MHISVDQYVISAKTQRIMSVNTNWVLQPPSKEGRAICLVFFSNWHKTHNAIVFSEPVNNDSAIMTLPCHSLSPLSQNCFELICNFSTQLPPLICFIWSFSVPTPRSVSCGHPLKPLCSSADRTMSRTNKYHRRGGEIKRRILSVTYCV